MSRGAVWKLLSQDPVINGLGFTPATNMYGNNAIDREKRGGPFLVLAWGDIPTNNGLTWRDSQVTVQEVRVWVHVNKYDSNDYGLINKVLDRAKDLLTAAVHVPGGDGWILSQADWAGDSGDLTDDILNTLTRNSAFRVSSRKA